MGVVDEFASPESDWTSWQDNLVDYDWYAGTIFQEGYDHDYPDIISYDYYYFDDADYSWYEDYWKNDEYDLIAYNYFSDDYKVEDPDEQSFID